MDQAGSPTVRPERGLSPGPTSLPLTGSHLVYQGREKKKIWHSIETLRKKNEKKKKIRLVYQGRGQMAGVTVTLLR